MFIKKLFGTILVIVGFMILITPFTPGSILLVIGIDMIFGDRWPWWNKKKRDLGKFWKDKIR